MIRHQRADGLLHYADCEVGDLFMQNGEWWTVATLGEWRDDGGKLRRSGTSRPSSVMDAAALLLEVAERLERVVAAWR